MRRYCLQRPNNFTIDSTHYLARGLVFAGLAPGGMVGSTRYHDSSLHGNHGTLMNMDPPTDWVFDQTLGRFTCTFLGTSNQYVALPFFSPSYPHTLAGWARSPGSAHIDIISIAKSSTNYDYFSCGTTADNTFLYAYRHDGNQWIQAGTVAANTWYHVCGVSRASNAHELFVNGISIGTDTTNSVPTGLNRTRIALLGRSGLIYSTGDIADVAVWNRALSPAEISQLADPSNTLLSGLILPPKRQIFATYTSTTPTTDYKVYRKMNYYRKLRSF